MIFYQKILAMHLYDAIHGLITVYAYLIDWILCEYSAAFEFGRVPPPQCVHYAHIALCAGKSEKSRCHGDTLIQTAEEILPMPSVHTCGARCRRHGRIPRAATEATSTQKWQSVTVTLWQIRGMCHGDTSIAFICVLMASVGLSPISVEYFPTRTQKAAIKAVFVQIIER